MKPKAVFNWSSGKDATLALYKTLQNDTFDVNYLLTSISKQYDRISMHGVRTALLEQQAASIGIPLVKMEIPEMPTMEVYEAVMQNTLTGLKAKGITHSIFGDIFLEDLRLYRENKLASMDLQAVFPLWKIPTTALIREFIALGFKTIVTCVNEKHLDKSFAGRIIDDSFINDLPDTVDPCGENGEFHTFTFDGPLFKEAVRFEIGEIVHRKYEAPKTDTSCNTDPEKTPAPDYGFWYCDLIPK
ncbi:Dph6-related ATP pyrophosphatase [Flavobacterium inviolabile]|uniref:Dph6-related ATP pyrophosphatase n=1 Tax=Flavobacterium inviolabile TaxID=2748320 RepID=UPI0015ABE20C|nr:diphthine--ammonia ligase [Flavobacterium inviolabile]